MNTKQKQNEISYSTITKMHGILSKTIKELINMEIAEFEKNGDSADYAEIVKHWSIIMGLQIHLRTGIPIENLKYKVLGGVKINTK